MDTLTTVRYIDANKLMSALCLRSCYNREHRCDNDSAANEDLKVVEMIKEMPTIDAVPVVRCKDCMNRGNELECPMCRMVHTWNEDDGSDWYVVDNTADDGYCHCGEKMEEGAEDENA